MGTLENSPQSDLISVLSRFSLVSFQSCLISVLSHFGHVSFKSCLISVLSDFSFVSCQFSLISISSQFSLLSFQFWLISVLSHFSLVSFQACLISILSHFSLVSSQSCLISWLSHFSLVCSHTKDDRFTRATVMCITIDNKPLPVTHGASYYCIRFCILYKYTITESMQPTSYSVLLGVLVCVYLIHFTVKSISWLHRSMNQIHKSKIVSK